MPIQSRKRRALLLLVITLIVCFAASIGVDRAFGLFRSRSEDGLIFPPNVTRHFQTPEFSFTVQTNSLGFRDREFTAEKKSNFRILTLGDSFTYGWGVESEQSWPKVLEQELRNGGANVEVANLGKPAGSPRTYADVAERSVPLLKPDLIVVAVLQGDDLAQMKLPPTPPSLSHVRGPDATVNHPRIRAMMKRLYPNLVTALDGRANSDSSLALEWQENARIFMTMFTPEEKARLERIDAQARTSFFNGELNPSLVYLAIHDPKYFSQMLDADSGEIKNLQDKMAEQFARIQNVARLNNARVLIISMPYGTYVSAASLKSRARLGFVAVQEMLTANGPDESIRRASQTAGLAFHDFTQEFRQASSQRNFFFELDGHLNAAGHRYFAELLTPVVRSQITAR